MVATQSGDPEVKLRNRVRDRRILAKPLLLLGDGARNARERVAEASEPLVRARRLGDGPHGTRSDLTSEGSL